MFPSILRTSLKKSHPSNYILKPYAASQKHSSLFLNSRVICNFGTKKKKRVIELNPSRVDLESLMIQPELQAAKVSKQSYLEMRKKIQYLPWQEMRFDQLCALDQEILDTIETELRKDKFNISDEEFLVNQLKSGKQIPLGTYEQLDRHYKKVYSLLKNTNDFYDEFPLTEDIQKGYLHEIYLTDLKKDKQLNQIIARFIKHIAKPQKLQGFVEPTFVKCLLSLKRQLMLQGIHFETKAEKKERDLKKERVIQSNQPQQLPKIKILQILNYEYEFWQDVKHNRAKNGSESDFTIETREVPNPNESVLLRELYPTIKLKFIARNKASKNRERGFCLKADLLIDIDQKMKRRIKVEWKGPSDSVKNEIKKTPKKPSESLDQEQEEDAPRVNYMVIDYENIYDGNPTIRPVFYF